MSIVRFNPFFDDAAFDDAFSSWPFMTPYNSRQWNQLARPRSGEAGAVVSRSGFGHADVIERDGDYQVHVDLPGVEMKDIQLTVANGMLHVTAERRQKHEEKTEFSHKVERSYGKLERSIPLPENADLFTENATLDNGVLTVQFDKKPVVAPSRKLEIKMGPASTTA